MTGSARGWVGLGLVAWLTGCDLAEPSDQGQYGLDIGLVDQLGRDSHRVLRGSSFTVEPTTVLVEGELDEDQGGLLCATTSASGSLAQISDFEFRVDALGPGAVEFAAPSESCPANDDVLAELGPDAWSMIGVDPSAAVGAWVLADETAWLDIAASPGPAGAFPAIVGRPIEPLRVVADGEFSASPVLLDADADPEHDEAEIRWNVGEATLALPEHYRELATEIDEAGDRVEQTDLRGSLGPGQSFDATLELLGDAFALPEVQAVGAGEIVDLALVPIYWGGDADREWGPPAAIVAVATNVDGERILGVPLEWSVPRGRLIAEQDGDYADTILVSDCKATPKRPRSRGATVEARLGDLVARTELEWVALASDETDPDSPDCTGSACDCSTTANLGDSRGSALASLLLLGLGLRLRRRRASAQNR